MSSLDECAEQLYRAFARVSRPTAIEACPCCVPESEVCELTAVSNVRSISPALLSSYASSALLTAGSAADYLFFLPRILHISATNDDWWPDPEVTGRAINSTEPCQWHSDQQAALSDFYTEVIRESLEPERHHRIDSWICAIARSGYPVQPHLANIEIDDAASLSYFLDNAQTLPEKKLSNPFWELPCDAHDVIVSWFYAEPTRTLIEAEYGFVFPA